MQIETITVLILWIWSNLDFELLIWSCGIQIYIELWNILTNVKWQNLNCSAFTQGDSLHEDMKFYKFILCLRHQPTILSRALDAGGKFSPAKMSQSHNGLCCRCCWQLRPGGMLRMLQRFTDCLNTANFALANWFCNSYNSIHTAYLADWVCFPASLYPAIGRWTTHSVQNCKNKTQQIIKLRICRISGDVGLLSLFHRTAYLYLLSRNILKIFLGF